MKVKLPDLPYDKNGLEPFISQRTIEFHYGKHHSAYVTKANDAISGTPFEQMDVEEILKATFKDESKTAIFNNLAQAWNHSFYWQCMKPNGGGKPGSEIASKIDLDFGSYEKFIEEFKNAAATQFGSGWAWLVLDIEENKLKIVKTSNADTPIVHGLKPLLTIDVWEHAYYLDYQNLRPKYIDTFLEKLINWDFVNSNFT